MSSSKEVSIAPYMDDIFVTSESQTDHDNFGLYTNQQRRETSNCTVDRLYSYRDEFSTRKRKIQLERRGIAELPDASSTLWKEIKDTQIIRFGSNGGNGLESVHLSRADEVNIDGGRGRGRGGRSGRGRG